jgi:GT2 family glycosyltransferase
MNPRISIGLVLYKTPLELVQRVLINVLESSACVECIVLDNSPTPNDSPLLKLERIRYIHSETNLGFGGGHNKIFFDFCKDSDFHLILNPDISFSCQVLGDLLSYFDAKNKIVALMPSVLNPDGSSQNLCKLLPTPIDLIGRRFFPSNFTNKFINSSYVLSDLPTDRPLEVPMLSGCFLLVRSANFRAIGGFDERFFMYMEDVDLIRRLSELGRVLYIPMVNVFHDYAKGSYRNMKLLIFHIFSAIIYFNKWGWFFDSKRHRKNHQFLKTLNQQ